MLLPLAGRTFPCPFAYGETSLIVQVCATIITDPIATSVMRTGHDDSPLLLDVLEYITPEEEKKAP